MNPESQTVEITDGFAHLALDIQRREREDGRDGDWDRDWMITRVRATAPGFRADFMASLQLRELGELRGQIYLLHCTLQGSAVLEAMDGWLNLKAGMDRMGHVQWSVDITNPIGSSEARLTFEINNDQTYLPGILNQIDAVMDVFPLRGRA